MRISLVCMDLSRRPASFDPLGEIVAAARDLARMERSGSALGSAERRVLDALDPITGVRREVARESSESTALDWVDVEETDLLAEERSAARRDHSRKEGREA